MDFERIKANFRYRSDRSRNMSKRFPTRPAEPSPPLTPSPPSVMNTLQRRPSNPKQKPKKPVNPKVVSPPPNGKPQVQHHQKPSLVSSEQTLKPNTESQKTNDKPSASIEVGAPAEASSSDGDYDLQAPKASKPNTESIDTLSTLLFSTEYLQTLLDNPNLISRFTTFLQKYKPSVAHLVLQYLETQKAIKAVAYANAVAAVSKHNQPAATLSSSFEATSTDAFDTLLEKGLPAWVTYSLVKTSTACLTAEVTGRNTPLTQNLVGGLSEVFCLTDPNQKENPIVYATEEFYRFTGYGKDSVIGHNCRFLQGPKTDKGSVKRLKTAIEKGEQVCETLLNYRRDGRPFLNILMLAPLLDAKGNVKYYLGAQVDASNLVQGGRGVDGFTRFLAKREMIMDEGMSEITNAKQLALQRLKELSLSFDLEESAVVQGNSRNGSRRGSQSDDRSNAGSARGPQERKRIQEEDDNEDDSDNEDDQKEEAEVGDFKLSADIPSGQLPGIYKKYFLIKPYPSHKVIFASSSAKKLGKLEQHPFLAHIAAPTTTLNGLKDALKSGTPVTAKVAITSNVSSSREGAVTGKWGKKDGPASKGKTCWISATPMKDANDRIGVWMVVIVDKVSVASNTGKEIEALEKADREVREEVDVENQDGLPIKPKIVGQLDGDDALDFGKPEEDGEASGDKDKVRRSERNAIDDDAEDMTDRIDTESQSGSTVLRQNHQANHEQAALEPEHRKTTEDVDHEHQQEAEDLDTTDHQGKAEDVNIAAQGNAEDIDVEQSGWHTPTSIDDKTDYAESTPRQKSTYGVEPHLARDSGPPGLRAMDYLTSRSSKVADSEENHRWNIASPYSVD